MFVGLGWAAFVAMGPANDTAIAGLAELQEPRKQQYHALVVASDRVPGRHGARFRGVATDLVTVSAVLERNGFKVTRLKNPAREDLISALDEAKDLPLQSLFLFYYSGGGADSAAGKARLAVLGAESDGPEGPSSQLEQGELEALLHRVPSRYKVVIADTAGLGLCAPKPSWRGSETDAYYAFCAGYRAADTSRGGVFSQTLVAGLAGWADTDDDGTVRAHELAGYIRDHVSSWSTSPPAPRPAFFMWGQDLVLGSRRSSGGGCCPRGCEGQEAAAA